MEFKLVLALLMATVALCAILPAFVEAGDFYVINETTCDSASRQSSSTYTCKGCCKAKGYDSGKDNGNYCKCKKSGSSQSRNGDQVIEKSGWFGRTDVHETPYEAPASYGSMTHEYGY